MAASAENECGCTNISIMQLFHELKQKFPAVPDRVVSECIRQNFHDKGTCEAILSRENATYLLHSYPPSLKMSSLDPESVLSAKLQALTLCDKCSLSRPCSSSGPSGSQVFENASVSRNMNVSSAQLIQEQSSLLSSNTHVLPGGNMQLLPPSSDFQCDETNSVKGFDHMWQHLQGVKDSNISQVLCHCINCKKSEVLQEPSSLSSIVQNSNQLYSSEMCNPHQLPSRKDDTFSTDKCQSSDCEPEIGCPPIPKSYSDSAESFLSPQRSGSRPTSLNIDQSQFQQPQLTHSVPLKSSNFEPFHSSYHRNNNDNNNNNNNNNNNHHKFPSSSSAVYNDCTNTGPHVDPSQGVGQSSRRSEPSFNNFGYTTAENNPSHAHEDDDRHGDRTVVNSYQVNVNCSLNSGRTSSTVNVSGSSTRTVSDSREPHQKARSVIHMQPAPHYAGQNYWGVENTSARIPGSVSAFPQQPRSFTSVNLTLRPPSSEPQPPIDIHSGGSSLMYSTSSYDPNQGFRSKLQICIGPGGAGSVSAMRTQIHEPNRTSQVQSKVPQSVPKTEEPVLETPRPVSSLTESTTESTTSSESTLQDTLESIQMDHLHAATQALLRQQLERKNRLQLELRREKEKLRAMRRSVRGMEKDLAQRQLAKNKALPAVSTVQKVQRLKLEIRKLTEECEKMAQEVDNCSDPRVPLGETDEEFYKNIYTGQQGYVGSRPPSQDAPSHRPDPLRHEPPPDPDAREGRSWTCSECTFRNYWELNYCEQCDMPRILLGTDSPSINSCYCHPSASKPYPPSPLTSIPLMRSASPPKLN